MMGGFGEYEQADVKTPIISHHSALRTPAARLITSGQTTGRVFSEEHDVEQGKNPRDINTGDFPTKQTG